MASGESYLRLVVAVMVKGLVSAPTDTDLFNGKNIMGHHKIKGFQDVLSLHLNQYQQLLRFMHIVNNDNMISVTDPSFDKIWKVRPMITLLQQQFQEWCHPGKNNALDEGGIPSRHHWLRTFNRTKPHKYFIELIMACDSTSRFCWAFFVNEGQRKSIQNPIRGSNTKASKYRKVSHYQHEFDNVTKGIMDKCGITVAQMVHFSRILRGYDPEPDKPSGEKSMVYRLFADKRWDSLVGIIECMKLYDVSYTASVKSDTRYHIGPQLNVKVPEKINKLCHRGKYRSATTTVDGVKVNTCKWADSRVSSYASADLGCESSTCVRKMGRHNVDVSIPKMVEVRSENFRAVDQHDQLRLGTVRFDHVSRSKAWHKLFFGLLEVLVTNIYILACQVPHTSPCGVPHDKLTQRDFRWELAKEIIDFCNEGGKVNTCLNNEIDDQALSSRFAENSANLHHWDKMYEYVDAQTCKEHENEATLDPPHLHLNKPRGLRNPRARDQFRKDHKVRSPIYFTSPCVVCWAAGKSFRTDRYCRECAPRMENWSYKTRGDGYMGKYHPRLCSQACFDKYHKERIHGLDYNQKSN